MAQNYDETRCDEQVYSRLTVNRLISTYGALVSLAQFGEETVTSSTIASLLGVDPTQVRKDMDSLGVRGKRRVGYPIRDLLLALERFLDLDRMDNAVIIGAGRLGGALAEYPGFAAYGMHIVGVFDNDPAKVGRPLAGRRILGMDKLPGVIRTFNVTIAVLTVPASAAQEVADLVVKYGIRGIWNFAPVHITVPDHVVVHNENIALGIARLKYEMKLKACSTSASGKKEKE